MERITDAWSGMERRERVLLALALVVLVAVLLAFMLLGGEEDPAVDASTTSQSAAVEPAPVQGALVAGEPVAPQAAPVPAVSGKGVAAVSTSGGGGDVATGDAIESLREEAARNHVGQEYDPGIYVPPVVSDAIKAAGRDLERVGAEYRACHAKAKAENTDLRPCIVLKFGVTIESELPGRGGIALTKISSDGHRLDFIVMDDGTICRALDEGESCTAWTAS